jgi:hypothetical protein
MSGAPLTHDDLVTAVGNCYPAPHWIYVEKVQDASGFEGTRTADAVAFGLYASLNFEVNIIEGKVSRGDWLHDLHAPDKADAFQAMGDRFWVAAPGPEVVPVSEVPAPWGVYYVKRAGDGFRVQVRRQAAACSGMKDALPRAFAAALLTRMANCVSKTQRRFSNTVPVDEFDQAQAAAFQRGKEYGAQEVAGAPVIRELSDLRGSVAAFERASGVRIGAWDGELIGECVRLVLEARQDLRLPNGAIERALQQAREVVGALSSAAKLIEEARATLRPNQKAEVPP